MTNGVGHGFNIEADFAAYDRLPRKVRELLGDATTNVSAESTRSLAKRMGLDNKELAEEVEVRSRNLARELALEFYGPEHPQAKQACRWPLNPRSRRQHILSLDTRMSRL